MEEKEKFIEDTNTKFTKMMVSGFYLANLQLVEGETVQCGVPIAKELKTVGTMTETYELIRDFPKKELSPERKNLAISSSIIGKPKIYKSIPIDRAIQAYLGSNNIEKIKVLIKHDQKK